MVMGSTNIGHSEGLYDFLRHVHMSFHGHGHEMYIQTASRVILEVNK
jgi:hypothetical protein